MCGWSARSIDGVAPRSVSVRPAYRGPLRADPAPTRRGRTTTARPCPCGSSRAGGRTTPCCRRAPGPEALRATAVGTPSMRSPSSVARASRSAARHRRQGRRRRRGAGGRRGRRGGGGPTVAPISSMTSAAVGRAGAGRAASATAVSSSSDSHGLEVGGGEAVGDGLAHRPLGEEEGQGQGRHVGGPRRHHAVGLAQAPRRPARRPAPGRRSSATSSSCGQVVGVEARRGRRRTTRRRRRWRSRGRSPGLLVMAHVAPVGDEEPRRTVGDTGRGRGRAMFSIMLSTRPDDRHPARRARAHPERHAGVARGARCARRRDGWPRIPTRTP